MQGKDYESRLAEWSSFRDTLESSTNPFQDLIHFYMHVPLVSIHTDPWNQKIWPDPWELILENQYCSFCKILGYYYTLALTERFSDSQFEIHISMDHEQSETYYMLKVDDTVLGYKNTPLLYDNWPSSLVSQKSYTMTGLQ